MNKRGLIGTIIVVGVLLVIGFFWFVGEAEKNKGNENLEKCVPASCCHAKECVWKDNAPNCSTVFCTMSCEPDTMDCGAGQCEVVEGECEVVWNE